MTRAEDTAQLPYSHKPNKMNRMSIYHTSNNAKELYRSENSGKQNIQAKDSFTHVNILFKVTSANPVIGVTQKFVITLAFSLLMKS